MPIGGVCEKTIAARRVKVEELPDYIREGLQVHIVDYFSDVLKLVYPFIIIDRMASLLKGRALALPFVLVHHNILCLLLAH